MATGPGTAGFSARPVNFGLRAMTAKLQEAAPRASGDGIATAELYLGQPMFLACPTGEVEADDQVAGRDHGILAG